MPKKRPSELLRDQYTPYKRLLPGTRKMLSDRFRRRDAGKLMLLKEMRAPHFIALAEAHIKMYEARLKSGSPIVNVPDTTRLLNTWKDVKDRTERGAPLTMDCWSEVEDALFDGGYDELLAAVKT